MYITSDMMHLSLSKEQIKDVRNLARGVYAPLTGFLREADFRSVVSNMRLTDGSIFPIPVVLDVDADQYKVLGNEKEVLLVDSKGGEIAVLINPEFFAYDKEFFAKNVYGTLDKNHPGVNDIYKMKKYLVGGDLKLLDDSREPFPEYNFTPQETKNMFRERGWNTVVAFQTRNVPHRGHEFLQKHALESTDGLFIQPVIGEKKLQDFKDEYILASYEALINGHYPKDKVLLGILPLKMRYAGPREAVFHALIRRNYGCTHFIVGRDHAGVGNYYTPFAAQEIFETFDKGELGIEIMKLPEVVYNSSLKKHMFIEDCPEEDRVAFSGTGLREYIDRKEQPPEYLIRPRVYEVLVTSYNALVDEMYKKNSDKQQQQGFVLWFTGLSGSGKSKIADEVYEVLMKRGLRVERLDGDVIREYLSKGLGFSKEDRDENIKRVGFVAGLLSKNGVGVVSSFISPYSGAREGVRQKVDNFIEVFCNCPVEICEERDTKGLYKKARAGEIKNFTGISDPYEPPKNPEIELFTDKETEEESTEKVISYLSEKGFLK